MTARLIAGLTVAAGMGLVGTAQAQFHTDFDTAGGPFVVPVSWNNQDISSVGLADYYAGGGGDLNGNGFEDGLPANSFEVAGGVGTMTVDASNHDTGARVWSFWAVGINKAGITLPVGTTLADLNLSALVRGTGYGAGAGMVINLRQDGAFDDTVNILYSAKVTPDGSWQNLGGNILTDFTNNDTDPFDPKVALDLTQPLKIQIDFDNGANGWGIDAGNVLEVTSMTFVPEPASLSLLALGGLAMLRRRA